MANRLRSADKIRPRCKFCYKRSDFCAIPFELVRDERQRKGSASGFNRISRGKRAASSTALCQPNWVVSTELLALVAQNVYNSSESEDFGAGRNEVYIV